MRMSKLFLPTLKEVPKEATITSHILMLRAGLVRKSASGLYAYLPLGYRVIKKITDIVREEMDKIGGQEFLMPILTSRELWEETGRYQRMGKEMWRIQDRHNQDYVLGPTHEEAFTDVVRSFLSSYRQLPLTVYQVYKKFRDEIRPRFGVMRSREFTMKDAYSFHRDETDLDKTYQDFRSAYRRFFLRCGLETSPVQADSGNMGGNASEEFMVKSQIGEETIIDCPACAYVANVERAEMDLNYPQNTEKAQSKEKVHTPGIKTIEQLKDFFKADASLFIKSLIYKNEDNEVIMVLIRGDLDVNDIKLTNALGGKAFFLADEGTVYQTTKAPVGFAGPLGMKDIRIIADLSVKNMRNAITGANEKDYHWKNVNPERDFTVSEYANLRLAKNGDPCPRCQNSMQTFKGIEVGHIFKLGYKYTKEMQVQFLDEQGSKVEPIMGTYGIGIDRTLATVIEQNNDAEGIIWPMSIAPYHVVILPLAEEGEEIAVNLYQDLWAAQIETLLDDRDARAGIKFKDADLIGIPIRVTLGKKTLAEKKAEVRNRRTGETKLVDLDNLFTHLQDTVRTEKELLLKKASQSEL